MTWSRPLPLTLSLEVYGTPLVCEQLALMFLWMMLAVNSVVDMKILFTTGFLSATAHKLVHFVLLTFQPMSKTG